MSEAATLYVRDGDAFVGTSSTQNGWVEGAQSGGAVLALLGHLLEDLPSATPMSLSRVTVDLFRPVPIGERLWFDLEVRREGRLIQVVEAVVRSADAEHVRAHVLRIRDEDVSGGPVIEPTTDDAELLSTLPGPDDLPDVGAHPGIAGFLRNGAELRRTAGERSGPDCAWVRLRVPVLAGEPVRTTSLVGMSMDCVNLIGITGLPAGVTAINPDVSAHVVRPPRGEWIGLVGDTRFAHGIGHGFSAATMVDRDGVIGVTSTSQVVQRHR